MGAIQKTCVRCREPYVAGSNRGKYCSRRCQMGERSCEQCGTLFVPKKNTARRFCSSACFYEQTVPTGTRRPWDRGYVIVKVPLGTAGTKLSGNRRGHWMLEHRYVMQQVLGRVLESWESVHHKNGRRDDNRPENLELWKGKRAQPAGIRQADYHCPGCTCFD